MRPQVGAPMRECLQIAGLVGIVTKAPFHDTRIRLGDAGQKIAIFSGIMKHPPAAYRIIV